MAETDKARRIVDAADSFAAGPRGADRKAATKRLAAALSDEHGIIKMARAYLAAEERVKELEAALRGLVSDRHGHAAGCVCPWCNARRALKKEAPDNG